MINNIMMMMMIPKNNNYMHIKLSVNKIVKMKIFICQHEKNLKQIK